MLKRSLALGALMAFVITGQAWAAEVTNYYNGTGTAGTAVSIKDGGEITADASYNYVVNTSDSYAASKLLGQAVAVGGENLKYTGNVVAYHETNSKRNLTGNGSAIGLDIYESTIEFAGENTSITVKSLGSNKNAIDANGVSVWNYRNNNDDNDAEAVLKFTGKNASIVVVGNNSEEKATTADEDVLKYGQNTGVFVVENGKLVSSASNTLEIDVTSNGKAKAVGFDVEGGIVDAEGVLKITAVSTEGEAYGFEITNEGFTATTDTFDGKVVVDFKGDTYVNVTGDGRAVGAYIEKDSNSHTAEVGYTGENITFIAESSKDGLARGVVVKMADVTIGNTNSNVKFDITSGYEENNCGMAVWAYKPGANVEINGSSLVVEGTELNGGELYGLIASSTKVETSNQQKITVNSTDTNIRIVDGNGDLAGSALVAMSGGLLDAKNNVKVEAKNAILARGSAVINVGAVDKKVQLTGNVDYGYDEATSKSSIDATVNLVLDGANSYWIGNSVIASDGVAQSITMDDTGVVVAGVADNLKDKHKVSNFNLTISDGAKWETSGNSFANTLNLREGIISLTKEDVAQTVLVGVASGDGGTINLGHIDSKVEIKSGGFGEVTINGSGAVADAIASSDSAELEDLVDNVTGGSTTVTAVSTDEGAVAGAMSAKVANGVVGTVTEAVNTVNQSIGEAAVNLKAHYRAHMNDMNKRMGELRMANGETGVWTRMVRGENEFEGAKSQYNQYQLGYDEKLSVDKRWTVGAAVTFAEGSGNFANGSTEDDSTAFAIYGSKLNNDGTFVDLIARYARLESDITMGRESADYSTNGYSVSAEFGKRIQQGKGLWIEPQVELMYGNVDSAEYTIAGRNVQVGDMDSLIGRVGFRLGKDIKEGNVYARASYLYDFDGETETTFSNASGLTRTIEEDLGGGWWEVGVGANINLSKATYIYADIEKTFGGEVDTNWQWNLGVRYSF